MKRPNTAAVILNQSRFVSNAIGGAFVAATALGIAGAPALAQSPQLRDPDWPCQQIKVPALSLAAVWSGPAIDPSDTGWKDNPAVSALVEKVTPRRTPTDVATSLVQAFAQQERDRKTQPLLAVLTGIFSVLSQEHDSVVAGLDRFGSRQQQLAAQIREGNEKLRALQSGSQPDIKTIETMTQRVTWDVQVFEDRRQALSYACEVPAKIEQRLFMLARAIQQELG